MSAPTEKIAALAARIEARLPNLLQRAPSLPDELCYEVQPSDLKQVCVALRDDPGLRFEILIDLAGVDYLEYGTSEWKTLSATGSGFSRGVSRAARRPHEGARFAVVYQLLSISNNQRVRISARCEEVRYDADKQRVVYEPVTIEPRTLVPKVIRNDNRYDAALKK